MYIETEDVIFETFFQHAQIEITGKCNMRCEHCRAWDEAKINMPLEKVEKIISFATRNADSSFRLTISGGEPFIHPNLVEIVSLAKQLGVEDIIITTNGSLVNQEKIAKLEELNIRNLCIQVSLDSINADTHDKFRGFRGAFDRAVNCIKLVSDSKLVSSLRATITPTTLPEVESLVEFAHDLGVRRVGIGSVIPVGAGSSKSLLLSPDQKKLFLETLARCKRTYTGLDVTTEDPLKFVIHDTPWEYGDFDISSDDFFGGCTAGISGFNANSEGVLTPCAVLLRPIVDVTDLSVDDIKEQYQLSPIVRELVERNLKDKCGNCSFKRLCGGCRAVAYGNYGDYMKQDATCWL